MEDPSSSIRPTGEEETVPDPDTAVAAEPSVVVLDKDDGDEDGNPAAVAASPSSFERILRVLIDDLLGPPPPPPPLLHHHNHQGFGDERRRQRQTVLPDTAGILVTIVRNALRSHSSERFRKIRLSNPKVRIRCCC